MLRESADSLLVFKIELLCLKPVRNPHLFLSYCRTVAKAGTDSDEIVFEFLSHFTEHVQNYSPRA
jgi:hypothetical protein